MFSRIKLPGLIALVALSAVTAATAERPYPEGAGGIAGAFQVGHLPDHFLLGDSSELLGSVVYRFAGAVDSGEQTSNTGEAATSVQCTNTGGSSASVEVQILDFDGTVHVGSATISPSFTLTYTTHLTAFYFDDVVIGGGGGTPAIDQGSGQVVSSSSNLICNATVVDPANATPEYLATLEMFE